jgi:serine/threonine protein kinase
MVNFFADPGADNIQAAISSNPVEPRAEIMGHPFGLHHILRLKWIAPKILDFGLARITNVDLALTPSLTQAQRIEGTPRYMSPEQVRKIGGSLQSPIVSLGSQRRSICSNWLIREIRNNNAKRCFSRSVGTGFCFDRNAIGLSPMNEYQLARWRLEQ